MILRTFFHISSFPLLENRFLTQLSESQQPYFRIISFRQLQQTFNIFCDPFTESGSGPIKLLTQGEVAIGLALTFQAVTEINDGQPFEIIYPPQGSPYSLTGTAIVEGHENKKGVQEVFDYLIHDCLVYDKENFSPETIYEGQIVTLAGYPENIPYADMQGIQDDQVKERLLSIWKY